MADKNTYDATAANDDEDELLEQKHFQHVIDAFLYYRTSSQIQVHRKQQSVKSLSQQHQSLISGLKIRLERMMKAIDVNYEFIKDIVLCVDEMFANSQMKNDSSKDDCESITSDDMDRVRTTLRQCVRVHYVSVFVIGQWKELQNENNVMNQ